MGWEPLDKGMIHNHAIQNGAQFETYKLSISGICQLICLDYGWSQVTEATESKTIDSWGRGGDYCIHFGFITFSTQ